MTQRSTLLGRVVATELRPATPNAFSFYSRSDARVGVGSVVRVTGSSRRVYGVVEGGAAFRTSDAAATASDSLPGMASSPDSGEVWLWHAAVLRQIPDAPLQPVPLADVYLADADDLHAALRMDAFTGSEGATGVPFGLYQSGDVELPVYLDADFLLGPEAAHLSISGVSGLATKTSAVETLLASVFQALPASKGSIAAVCLNVKGSDLLFLDQAGDLDAVDLARYARLGLTPTPFESVQYFAPYRPDGVNLNTLRTHPALAANVQPLVWGLREVLDFAEVLLNQDDLDAKADAFVDFLADRVVDKSLADGDLRSTHCVQSFADLERFFRDIFDSVEKGRRDIWRTHHTATIRKVRNRLLNISTRAKGLVTEQGETHDLPWGGFEDRTVYVIDLANVDPTAQELVFARVISKLREHLERRDLGVDQVVVFVDELNKYAPADGADTYVKRMLLDVAERGRYLGLVLFAAQQFRSQVHRRIVGNAGTVMFGRSDMDELATAGYAILPPAIKMKLATLPKGELMVRHPHFTQPIFVRFPRPAVLRGPDGVERFPPANDVPFEEAVVRRLVGLDPTISPAAVRDAIADRREEDVVRALHATHRAGTQRVWQVFQRRLGDRVPVETAAQSDEPHAPLTLPDDPYAN